MTAHIFHLSHVAIDYFLFTTGRLQNQSGLHVYQLSIVMRTLPVRFEPLLLHSVVLSSRKDKDAERVSHLSRCRFASFCFVIFSFSHRIVVCFHVDVPFSLTASFGSTTITTFTATSIERPRKPKRNARHKNRNVWYERSCRASCDLMGWDRFDPPRQQWNGMEYNESIHLENVNFGTVQKH